jgi:GTP-binding protein
VLLSELGRYQPDLLDRPRLVVGSKADVATEAYDGMHISAATRSGLDEFLGRVADLVDEARVEPDAPDPIVVLRPQEEGISIVQEAAGVWRVQGRVAERAVSVSDFRDPDALVYVQQRLQKIGVDRALARAGAREGDVVRIGDTELEYEANS